MRRFLLFGTFLLILFNSLATFVNADSDYVLPYPSSMPGSAFYKLYLFKDVLLKYWHFGDYGQFIYNLKQSDKYLVEAKTLFEYKQYLLAYRSLEKSNRHFQNTIPYLLSAKNHKKSISNNVLILRQASLKHQEALTKLKNELPEEFTWSPEKAPKETLKIKQLINNSIALRKNYEKTNL